MSEPNTDVVEQLAPTETLRTALFHIAHGVEDQLSVAPPATN